MSDHPAQPTSLRSALGRVRGLGAARGGTEHWLAQRLTSLALLPLTLWLVISVASLAGAGHAAAVEWIAAPVNALLLLLTLGLTFHHTAGGLQVIIEDYVRPEGRRFAAILAVKAICLVAAAASALAVLRIAL